MLPDIRVVLAAVAAAVLLLVVSFGLVAAFRVAQDSRAGLLQADLAQRGRNLIPVSTITGTALPNDGPEPLDPNPVQRVEIADAPEIPVALVAPQAEPLAEAPEPPTIVAAASIEPPAIEVPREEALPLDEPPMGGPLTEQAEYHPAPKRRPVAHEAAIKKKAEQARKARTARIARERKIAAAKRARAAQARARQQTTGSISTSPAGSSFGNYGNNNFGNYRTGSFGQ